MNIRKFIAVLTLFLFAVPVLNAQDKAGKNYNDMISSYNGGNKKIALDIALSYKYGWNEAPQNPAKAIEWLDKAFDADIYRAATMAGSMYRTADGVKVDFAKAEKYYRKAAAKGNEDAMIRLGQMYYYGNGVKESYESAKKWYYEAAKKYTSSKNKCSLACVYYADMNFYSSPTEPNFKSDYDEALKWYEKAYNSGYMEASTKLAIIYSWKEKKQDIAKGESYLISAAQKGYYPAMQELVDIYLNNKYGLGNPSKAYAWASLVNAREDLLIDATGIMKKAEDQMSAAELEKAKKTSAALIRKLGKTIYPDHLKDID